MQVVGPALSTTGSYPITHFRPGLEVSDRRADLRRRRRLPQGRARAALLRHRLGQDLREHGRPAPHGRRLRGLAAQLDEGGDRRRRLRGARARRQGRGARPLRQRRADRRRGRRGLDRARRLDPPRDGRGDGAQGHLSLPDADRRALRLGPARAAAGCAICAESEKIQAKSFANCRKAGVKVVFGTDAGGFPWTEINQAQEFEWEVKLGMSPLEAIQSATTVGGGAARLAGQGRRRRGRRLGRPRRRRGRPARRRLLSCPTIDWVMKGGQVVRSPAR